MKLAGSALTYYALPGMVMVSGCVQLQNWRHPEVASCDEYTRATLKTPATYQRVRATLSDSRLPLEFWQQKSELVWRADQSNEMRTLASEFVKSDAATGGVRSVIIEYDALNGFGVPTRGLSLCKFELKSTADERLARAPTANGAILTLAMASAGIRDAPEVPCC